MGTQPDFVSFYRWHVPDPIMFERDLRVTIQQIGAMFFAQGQEAEKAAYDQHQPGRRRGLDTDGPPALLAWGICERVDDYSCTSYVYCQEPQGVPPRRRRRRHRRHRAPPVRAARPDGGRLGGTGRMSETMTHHLTADEQAQMERDGYVVRESRVRPRRGRRHDRRRARTSWPGSSRAGTGRRFTVGSYTFEPDVLSGRDAQVGGRQRRAPRHRAVRPPERRPRGVGPRPAAGRADGDFVGDDEPVLYTEKLNLKRPRIGGINPLHQDYPYWVDRRPTPRARPPRSSTSTTPRSTNGCLEVAPGSHRSGAAADADRHRRVRQPRDGPGRQRPPRAGAARGARRVGGVLRRLPGPRHRPEPHRHEPPGAAVQLPAGRCTAHARGAPQLLPAVGGAEPP